MASYARSDGSVTLRVRGRDGKIREFDGTHYFSEEGASCVKYPTLPVSPKEFCNYIVPLGDGRYEQSFSGGTVDQILEGEQLGRVQ